MNASSLPSLYNPRSQNDDNKFIAEFVARHGLLETLLRRLQAANSEDLSLHQILIGSRGMGKTSLLRRIAIAIDLEPDLSTRFVPLSFREEQYNVLTLGDFWRNCGESLAEWADTTGQADLAQRLDNALPTEAWASNEKAAKQFNVEMMMLGRQPILLVDNLDLILDALSDEDNWVLRRHLQARNGPILIGASTHSLKQSADRDAAFYEFFHPTYLEPLDNRETEHCMRALARSGGEHGTHVVRILDRHPERLRTLHTLTGGNPRVLALIYRLLGTDESEAAMADLERLLDQVTPYYKAKVEEYQTAQQRAVVDAIALHWDPITTGDLASLTRVPTTTLSPLLMRLRKDGLIENVELSGAYAGHQLAERFLNIWYLMRHGTRRTKQKMRWLVAFLTSFYSLSELTEIAGRTLDRTTWHQLAFEAALERQTLRVRDDEMRDFAMVNLEASVSPQIIPFDIPINDRPLDPRKRNRQKSRSALNQGLNQDALDSSTDDQAASAIIDEAISLARSGNGVAAIALYDDILMRFSDAPEPGVREQVARTLVFKAIALGQMGDNAAEIALYDDVLIRFGGAPEISLREQVARALIFKAITLGQLGDNVAAIALYDDVLIRFDGAPEPGLREQVARTLVFKATTLRQMGNNLAAIALYNDVLIRFDGAPEQTLREQVARALVSKAVTLGQMSDSAAEIALYDDVLIRFGSAPEPSLREQVARALVFKAMTLGQMGDNVGAIALYDDVLIRFDGAPEQILREQVARALVSKAIALGQMGDNAAAIALYDDILIRFDGAPEQILREQVAKVLVGKAVTLGQMGDNVAAIALYNDIVIRFDDAPEQTLREQVARALVSKAIAVGQMGDNAAEIALYDDVLIRFGSAPETSLREQVARALIFKAIALGQMSDNVAAIALYDDVLIRFDGAPEQTLREHVARALIFKAIALGQMGDNLAAIALYDDVLLRFDGAPEQTLREQVAYALVFKAMTLGQIGDNVAAIAVYDDVLVRFGNAPNPTLREQVANALYFKAIALRDEGQIRVAIDAFEHILELTSNELNSFTKTKLATARIALANMLLDFQGDLIRPEALYREAIPASPLPAKANLAWFYLLADRLMDASREWRELTDLPKGGLALLNAGIDLASDNFGSAASNLAIALNSDLNAGGFTFGDDIERLLRLSHHKGYGERLLTWFEQTGFADQFAPIYVAFKAYVETDKILLDVNPEVRRPAKTIYDRLDAPRRHAADSIPKKLRPPRRLRNATPRGRS